MLLTFREFKLTAVFCYRAFAVPPVTPTREERGALSPVVSADGDDMLLALFLPLHLDKPTVVYRWLIAPSTLFLSTRHDFL